MVTTPAGKRPAGKTQRRRPNGAGSQWWDAKRQRYVGQITVVDDDGTRRRRTVFAPTQDELSRRLAQLQTSVAADIDNPTHITVATYLDHWLANVLPLENRRPNTERAYGDVVRRYIKPHIGKRELADLTPRDVERMMTILAGTYAPSTVSKARKVLARALKKALRDGLVSRNVAALVDGVAVPRNPDKNRALTVDQAMALLAAAEAAGSYALVSVMLGLGLRRGEAAGLRWCEVDLDANNPTLTVNGVISFDLAGRPEFSEIPKTSTSRRRLHLPATVVAALRRHKATQLRDRLACVGTWGRDWPHDDFVFTSSVGTPLDLNRITRLVVQLAADAGIGHWTPHHLRHSSASLLIAQGVPLKEVSETLGHSSIRVTADVYGHLYEPARRAAADAMQAAIFS